MRNIPKQPSKNELQSWHSLGGVENICELRKSSIVLYGIFTELARLIYHSDEGRLIGTPNVIWTPTGTDIWIDNELRWEDQHPEVRPAIYIQLSPLQYDSVIPATQGQFETTDRFGTTHYEQKAVGQVTFMHVASTSGEACALADNTDYFLSMMQAPIRDDFCFTKFTTAGRTPLEKLPPEASDKYASGVTYGYEFAEAWDVKEECPILKSINSLYVVEDIPSNLNSTQISNSNRHDTIDRANIFIESKVSGEPGK